jgi:hypothetical protein
LETTKMYYLVKIVFFMNVDLSVRVLLPA